jgi:hypothetical protein
MLRYNFCVLFFLFQFSMNMNNDDLTNPFEESNHLNKMNNTLPQILSMKDWPTIQSSYMRAFRHESTPCSYNCSDILSTISCWSQVKNQIALHFIDFFRQIDEFKILNGDDRFALVKHNFVYLLLLHKCSNYDPSMGLYSDLPNEAQKRLNQWIMNCREASELGDKLLDLMHSFVNITEQEPILSRLVYLLLLFSTDALMTEDTVQLNDPLSIVLNPSTRV